MLSASITPIGLIKLNTKMYINIVFLLNPEWIKKIVRTIAIGIL